MTTSGDAARYPWMGFWQVVYTESEDEIVPYAPLHTTLSLRRSGFSLYTRSRFVQFRAAANRRPAAAWPATEAERRSWFDTCHVSFGACTWTHADGGWNVSHEPVAAAGGEPAPGTERRAVLEGDKATVGDEPWRRLSGAGASPLAGAWEQTGPSERWTYLISAGHYAVVRQRLDADEGELGSVSGNAGARVESARSFDHWPFIATGGIGSIDARKHETFRLTTVELGTFSAGFASDGSDASPWQRIE